MRVIVLEPDRRVAGLMRDAFVARGASEVEIVQTIDAAVATADINKPDVLVTELSLGGHSGAELLYEFRTYSDWQDVRIIVFSAQRVPQHVRDSRDWRLLSIEHVYYKPDVSLGELASAVVSGS